MLPLPPNAEARVKSYCKLSHDVTEYVIEVTWGAAELPDLRRRYSAFRDLHAHLRSTKFGLPPNLKEPPRRLLVNDAVRQERVAMLDNWLCLVMARAKRHAPPDALLRFLSVRRPTTLPELRLWEGGEHGEYGEYGESSPSTRPSGSGRSDRPASLSAAAGGGNGPVLSEAPGLDGGLQGAASQELIVDEDGDEAHEFVVFH